MPVSQPLLKTPDTGESLEFGNGSRTELAVSGSQSDGEYAVVRYNVSAGDEPPLHTHTREDEMVYVLEGEINASASRRALTCNLSLVGSRSDSSDRHRGDILTGPCLR